jgi:hypothetical protein
MLLTVVSFVTPTSKPNDLTLCFAYPDDHEDVSPNANVSAGREFLWTGKYHRSLTEIVMLHLVDESWKKRFEVLQQAIIF